VLERAQADGALARSKLDLRDAAERHFADIPEDQQARLSSTFNEELEAFCSDMRLASVTVQQQVERRHPPSLARIVGLAILGLIVGFFVGGFASNGDGGVILSGMLGGCVLGAIVGFNWRPK
jgi:hypothetical protein